MKKAVVSIIATILLLTLACGCALASTGDITIKEAKAYSDKDFTKSIGTIPKYTCVKVNAYGNYADITVNDVRCYVHPSTLTQGKYDYSYMGTAIMKKGALVYQRPSASAKYSVNAKKCTVRVFVIKDSLALIRYKKSGMFGFTSVKNLNKIQ